MAALPENERQAADSPRCRLGCRACRSGPDARIQDALSGAAGFRNLASHLIETAGQEIAFGLVGGEFEGLTIGLGRFRGPAELAQQVRLGGGQVPVTGEVATSANPYCRGQVCSQYADATMVSLRSAELIANLSLHGIPLGQNRAPSQLRRLSAKSNSLRNVFSRKEASRPTPCLFDDPAQLPRGRPGANVLGIMTGSTFPVCDSNHNSTELPKMVLRATGVSARFLS